LDQTGHQLIDGIAFGDPGTIYINTVTTGHLFRIPVGKDGTAGAITADSAVTGTLASRWNAFSGPE